MSGFLALHTYLCLASLNQATCRPITAVYGQIAHAPARLFQLPCRVSTAGALIWRARDHRERNPSDNHGAERQCRRDFRCRQPPPAGKGPGRLA
jgi:hypothetical protein